MALLRLAKQLPESSLFVREVEEVVQNKRTTDDVPKTYRDWYFALDFKGNLQMLHVAG
jgi:hypothetical protein